MLQADRCRTSSLRSMIIIPARLQSTRLPRKLLLTETGKPLIQHTWEAANRAKKPDGILVATDSQEIAAVVANYGGRSMMTSMDLASGTDRVAQAAQGMVDVDFVVNVQGDEPDLSGEAIDQVITLLEENPDAAMATLSTPIRDRAKLLDPSCVKVVCDGAGRALYFSRSPIPAVRDWDDSLLLSHPHFFQQHIGLYAYRRDFLLRLAELPRSPLEQLENLEQLRVLEAGHKIIVGPIDEPAIGIDTHEDYRAFVEQHRRRAAA